MENNGWFPKEAAPKDGSWFLILEKDGYACWSPYEFAAWQIVDWKKFDEADGITRIIENGQYSYFGGTDTSEEIEFDWWRPLPALPK